MFLVHGNAGAVSQGWRPDCYRNLASGDSHHIHVIAVDYRGFGHSTGSPNERGLITDGIAVVDYALNVIGIPPERIVIYGQSLGTAVSIAVAEYFSIEREIDFRAIILVAPFSDIPTLMLDYAMGGIIPILSPMRHLPQLQKFFADKIQETWFSAKRLTNLVRSSKHLDLYLLHAENDLEIPFSHSDELFYVAANATSEQEMTKKQIDAVRLHQDLDGHGSTDAWKAGQGETGIKLIQRHVVPSGGKMLQASGYDPTADSSKRSQPHHDIPCSRKSCIKCIQGAMSGRSYTHRMLSSASSKVLLTSSLL